MANWYNLSHHIQAILGLGKSSSSVQLEFPYKCQDEYTWLWYINTCPLECEIVVCVCEPVLHVFRLISLLAHSAWGTVWGFDNINYPLHVELCDFDYIN